VRLSASVVVVLALLVACGDDEPSTVEPRGQGSTPAGMACLDPRDPQPRPEGGWLRDDGSIVGGLPGDLPVVESSTGLDALVADVLAAVPAGFAVTDHRETRAEGGCALRRVVIARRLDGAFVLVSVEQLRGRRSMFSIPLGPDLVQTPDTGGSETVTDDFDGEGVRRTVLFATADGLLVEAVASGANAPDLSGWPTTTAPPPGPQPPAGPAPLSIAELERFARAIAARQSG
jgi:hypothetical protein